MRDRRAGLRRIRRATRSHRISGALRELARRPSNQRRCPRRRTRYLKRTRRHVLAASPQLSRKESQPATRPHSASNPLPRRGHVHLTELSTSQDAVSSCACPLCRSCRQQSWCRSTSGPCCRALAIRSATRHERAAGARIRVPRLRAGPHPAAVLTICALIVPLATRSLSRGCRSLCQGRTAARRALSPSLAGVGRAPEPTDRAWWRPEAVREAGRDELPITWVTSGASGAVGLGEFDIEERRDRSPWLLGMIVRPDRRARVWDAC